MKLKKEVDDFDVLANTPGVRRFKGADPREALIAAQRELGPVLVLQGRRLRRGGLGGMFSEELGVEILVRPDRGSDQARPSDAGRVATGDRQVTSLTDALRDAGLGGVVRPVEGIYDYETEERWLLRGGSPAGQAAAAHAVSASLGDDPFAAFAAAPAPAASNLQGFDFGRAAEPAGLGGFELGSPAGGTLAGRLDGFDLGMQDPAPAVDLGSDAGSGFTFAAFGLGDEIGSPAGTDLAAEPDTTEAADAAAEPFSAFGVFETAPQDPEPDSAPAVVADGVSEAAAGSGQFLDLAGMEPGGGPNRGDAEPDEAAAGLGGVVGAGADFGINERTGGGSVSADVAGLDADPSAGRETSGRWTVAEPAPAARPWPLLYEAYEEEFTSETLDDEIWDQEAGVHTPAGSPSPAARPSSFDRHDGFLADRAEARRQAEAQRRERLAPTWGPTHRPTRRLVSAADLADLGVPVYAARDCTDEAELLDLLDGLVSGLDYTPPRGLSAVVGPLEWAWNVADGLFDRVVVLDHLSSTGHKPLTEAMARQLFRAGSTAVVVGVSELPHNDEGVRRLIQTVRPLEIRVVVDASWSEQRMWRTAQLPGRLVMDVVNTKGTDRPCAPMRAGIPIVSVDGRPADARTWARIIMRRLAED